MRPTSSQQVSVFFADASVLPLSHHSKIMFRVLISVLRLNDISVLSCLPGQR